GAHLLPSVTVVVSLFSSISMSSMNSSLPRNGSLSRANMMLSSSCDPRSMTRMSRARVEPQSRWEVDAVEGVTHGYDLVPRTSRPGSRAPAHDQDHAADRDRRREERQGRELLA